MDGSVNSGRAGSVKENLVLLSFGVEARTDVGPGEGNRRGDNGQESVPHVSRRTNVRVGKECAEQQGNAAKRQNKRWTREREGGGGGETDGPVAISPSLYILTIATQKNPAQNPNIFPMVTRARDPIAMSDVLTPGCPTVAPLRFGTSVHLWFRSRTVERCQGNISAAGSLRTRPTLSFTHDHLHRKEGRAQALRETPPAVRTIRPSL